MSEAKNLLRRIGTINMIDRINNFEIDEITWNDLNMDQVYERLNTAKSSVGKEYLRKTLSTLELTSERLETRDKIADYLLENQVIVSRLDKIFAGLGMTKKVSFRDHIFKLNEIPQQSNVKHIILIILLLASIACIFMHPVIGIIALVAVFAINIATYFADKAKIEAYFICIKYLASMVVASDKICAMKLEDTPLSKHIQVLQSARRTFASVRRGSWLITNSVSGSLVDVIMDYVRMLFHVDLMKFNSMRKTAMEHTEDIDNLYNALGEIETCICIFRFRKELTEGSTGVSCGYVKPHLLDNARLISTQIYASDDTDFSDEQSTSASAPNSVRLTFSGIRHPLIDNCVPNSLAVERNVLLTGSNASGKSTFLRSIAINQILAQTIYTVLADSFSSCFYKVISSMALSDNLLNNESYFIVEIKSLKRIFDNIGDVPVLCFVDEVLRGTNTKERIAASTSILRSLAKRNVTAFAATHDIELTSLLAGCMDNYHFTERVEENDVCFDYKLKGGPATSRNAIKLLEISGFAPEIIDEAIELVDKI